MDINYGNIALLVLFAIVFGGTAIYLAIENKKQKEANFRLMQTIENLKKNSDDTYLKLPACAYKVEFYYDGHLIVRTGVLDYPVSAEARGIVYEQHHSQGKFINIELYPIAIQKEGEDEQ